MKVTLADLRHALRRTPRIGGAELCRALGDIDRSTLARLAARLDQEIIRRGGARRTRYALRRPLRGDLQPIALYRIDASGDGLPVGQLDLTYPEGSALAFDAPFDWLGDQAYQSYLDRRRDWASRLIAPRGLAAQYGRLALQALSQGDAGSSAAGNFPSSLPCGNCTARRYRSS